MGQTREQKIIKQVVGKPTIQKFTPIATDMFLPNHSGISSHPEFKNTISEELASYIKKDGTTTTTAQIPFALGFSVSTEWDVGSDGFSDVDVGSALNGIGNIKAHQWRGGIPQLQDINLTGGILHDMEIFTNASSSGSDPMIAINIWDSAGSGTHPHTGIKIDLDDGGAGGHAIDIVNGTISLQGSNQIQMNSGGASMYYYSSMSVGQNGLRFYSDDNIYFDAGSGGGLITFGGNPRLPDNQALYFGTGGLAFPFTDVKLYYSGGKLILERQTGIGTAWSEFVINENSTDVDVRIEGNGDANLFFTDAGNDRVGIGMNNPAYKLDVTGDANVSGVFRVGGTGGFTGTGAYTNFTIVGGIITNAT